MQLLKLCSMKKVIFTRIHSIKDKLKELQSKKLLLQELLRKKKEFINFLMIMIIILLVLKKRKLNIK